MNKTIGILGTNFNLSTAFVNKIISCTKANTDQEHIKMNIIISNSLLQKKKLNSIIKKLENINTDYLILTFNNQEVYNYLKTITNIPILNNYFDLQDNSFIYKIIKLTGKESI
ncbi:MAG: hypothetical protein IJ068_06390 [Bacilli bacterium]|nr:hypothetical protein [Bacilli bacterium]